MGRAVRWGQSAQQRAAPQSSAAPLAVRFEGEGHLDRQPKRCGACHAVEQRGPFAALAASVIAAYDPAVSQRPSPELAAAVARATRRIAPFIVEADIATVIVDPVAPDTLTVLQHDVGGAGSRTPGWHYCRQAASALQPYGEGVAGLPSGWRNAQHIAHPHQPDPLCCAAGADWPAERLERVFSSLFKAAYKFERSVLGGLVEASIPARLLPTLGASAVEERYRTVLFSREELEEVGETGYMEIIGPDQVMLRVRAEGDPPPGFRKLLVALLPAYLDPPVSPGLGSERTPLWCPCGKPGRPCKGCHAAWYCSAECQAAAYRAHRPLCKFARGKE